MLMKKTSLALVLALSLPAVAHADAPPAPPPPPSIAPTPGGAPTLIRITPLQGTVVFIQDADGVVGRFTENGLMTIPSGRTYQLSAMRGKAALWVGKVTADGRELAVVWSGGLEPKITVVTPTAPPPPAPPPYVPTRPTPMKSAQFDGWIQSMQVEAFDNNRLEMVRRIAAREWFTTAQVARILDVFNFESNRMNALEAVCTRITDPENSLVLTQRFTFAANRKRAAEILASQRR